MLTSTQCMTMTEDWAVQIKMLVQQNKFYIVYTNMYTVQPRCKSSVRESMLVDWNVQKQQQN